jgi:hypothetical protein
VSFTDSALVVSWAAIVLLGFALAGVLARVHRLEQAMAGPAPAPTPVGRPFPLPGIEEGPVLALFVDHDCRSCERAVAGVGELLDRGLATVYWREEEPEAFDAMDVPLTPYAVVADAELKVVSVQPVGSAERLAEVVATVATLAGAST